MEKKNAMEPVFQNQISAVVLINLTVNTQTPAKNTVVNHQRNIVNTHTNVKNTVAHLTRNGANTPKNVVNIAAHSINLIANSLINVKNTAVNTTTINTISGVIFTTNAETNVTVVKMDTKPASATVELMMLILHASHLTAKNAANTSGVKKHINALLTNSNAALKPMVHMLEMYLTHTMTSTAAHMEAPTTLSEFLEKTK